MSLQNLREERASIGRDIKALVDPARKWDAAADQPVYDTKIARVAEIDASIERINASNKLIAEGKDTEAVIVAAERSERDNRNPAAGVFAKWLRQGERGLSAEEATAFYNTMSTTTGSQGGYTVPTTTASTLIELLKSFGGMRDVASAFSTAEGNPMSFPTADATSEVGEIVAENTLTNALDTAFGTVSLPVYKYSSKSVAVPIELLMDSNIDVEAYINRLLGTRLARITNTHFTTGTGSSQPNGVVTAAGTGITAANSTSQVTAITYDSLVTLQHSVDPAYRVTGKCRFMMNDASIAIIRKVKDGNGRPIFVPGYETASPGGAPDMLLGSPITVNQDVAVMAANAKSVLFGDFSYYTIRDVMGVTLKRFEDSAFALKGQVGFCAWLRSGGNLLDNGGAVKLFINAAS